MKYLRVFSNIFLFIFLFFLIFTYLGMNAVERTVLSESFYENIIEENDIVNDIRSDLKDSLPDLVMDRILEDLKIEEIEEKFREAIIDRLDAIGFIDWDSLFDASEDIIENLIKDMVEIHVKLLTDSVVDAFEISWVEETVLESINEVLYFIKNGEGDLVLEIEIESRMQLAKNSFADKLKTLYQNEFGGLLYGWLDFDEIANQIFEEMDLPDSIDVGSLITEREDFQNIKRTVEIFRFFRKYFLVLPYILFAMIFVSFILLSDIFRAMKRFGWGVFIPSSIFILVVIAGRQIVASMLKVRIDKLPVDFGIVENLLSLTYNKALIVPIIFATAGLIFIISGTIGKYVNEKKYFPF